MFRWWKEWRAWVRHQKEAREEILISSVIDIIDEEWKDYSKRSIAKGIIGRIRLHDREGIR